MKKSALEYFYMNVLKLVTPVLKKPAFGALLRLEYPVENNMIVFHCTTFLPLNWKLIHQR